MGDARLLKEGTIHAYLKSCLVFRKWKECHARLFSDSRLFIYEKKGDDKPKVSVFLKDVIPYIAIGLVCDRMPVRRPTLPDGFSVHHLVGIGMDPEADTVHWILFSSDEEMKSWFEEIAKTFPPIKQPEKTPLPAGNEPPPAYPGTQGQPGQPGNATVIVQQQDNGADAALNGMFTGMLLGSMAGYGMGSMFGGGFYPMGMGYGGAFISDNDTTTINNYYGDGGPDSGVGTVDGGDYDGADYGGGDFGDFGDMGGGMDFGGGDFGGF